MTTSINWPAGFPSPAREGYAYAMADLTQRTDFALGARVRSLYSDAPDSFAKLSVFLSAAQWAYFQGFYRYTLKNGTQWFLLPLLAGGVLETREARFVGPPQPALVGARSGQILFACETREGTTMDAATWNLVQLYGDTDGLAAMMQMLEEAINGDLAGL